MHEKRFAFEVKGWSKVKTKVYDYMCFASYLAGFSRGLRSASRPQNHVSRRRSSERTGYADVKGGIRAGNRAATVVSSANRRAAVSRPDPGCSRCARHILRESCLARHVSPIAARYR